MAGNTPDMYPFHVLVSVSPTKSGLSDMQAQAQFPSWISCFSFGVTFF